MLVQANPMTFFRFQQKQFSFALYSQNQVDHLGLAPGSLPHESLDSDQLSTAAANPLDLDLPLQTPPGPLEEASRPQHPNRPLLTPPSP